MLIYMNRNLKLLNHLASEFSSVFTAEVKAVDLALDFIRTCDASNKFIIFSDSLSVLKGMNHTSSKNQQIQKLSVNPITVGNFAFLFNCTPVGRTSDF